LCCGGGRGGGGRGGCGRGCVCSMVVVIIFYLL